MTGDPLGLTPEQRRVSDINEFLRADVGAGPVGAYLSMDDEPYPVYMPDRVGSQACPYCRAIVGHAPSCLTNLETIYANTIEGEWSE